MPHKHTTGSPNKACFYQLHEHIAELERQLQTSRAKLARAQVLTRRIAAESAEAMQGCRRALDSFSHAQDLQQLHALVHAFAQPHVDTARDSLAEYGSHNEESGGEGPR